MSRTAFDLLIEQFEQHRQESKAVIRKAAVESAKEVKRLAHKQELIFISVMLVITLTFLAIISTALFAFLPNWIENTIDNRVKERLKTVSVVPITTSLTKNRH